MKISALYVIFLFSIYVNITLEKSAYCVLNQDQNSGVSGYVTFDQSNSSSPTLIQAYVKGLKPQGLHGFHIHEKANFSQGCISAGAHYNPFSHSHGSPDDDENRHVGDMGNLKADNNGTSQLVYHDSLISLFGEYKVIGRACVVHENSDDLGKGDYADSQTTGHAGARIACGEVIEGVYNIETEETGSSFGRFLIKVFLLILLVGGFYYFFIYRSKQSYQEVGQNE